MPQPVITTARTARHGLPYLFAGQAQKEAFVNEALARIDALVQPSVLALRSDPPATPVSGDCYLIGPAPTGVWQDRSGAIACWAESQWLFADPTQGALVYDRAADCLAAYDGAAGWRYAVTPAAPSGGATQDGEARAALAAVVAGLRTLGIFA